MRTALAVIMLVFAVANVGTSSLAQAQLAPRAPINAVTSGPFSECMFDEGYGRRTSCNGGGN